ncbi:hypothetical protein [Microbulbifer spongiae]|uniref:Uncharacterized protein n=1 Tax=Microbulbifer spongiae TaxID=2944933 RepID=A0ABY9E8D9_9GAMM|nr:hypothetical protein [Microbulbifer sp. MI-G]WKD49273.1 hypothetical protein M8T91_15415 [Microbulbifer sp. MI-G]
MLNTKQYLIEFGLSMVLYIIAIFFSISFLVNNPHTPWKVWISLLPILPAILATIAVIRALKRLDELQQRIQMMSFAISFAIVGLITFSYGFLENAGYPHIPYVWIFPFMIATWGISTPIVASVYK